MQILQAATTSDRKQAGKAAEGSVYWYNGLTDCSPVVWFGYSEASAKAGAFPVVG